MDEQHAGLAAHIDTSAHEAAVELDWADLRVGLERRRRDRAVRRAVVSVGAAVVVAVLALVWGSTRARQRPAPLPGRAAEQATAIEPALAEPVPAPTPAPAPRQTEILLDHAARLGDCDSLDGRACFELHEGAVELSLARDEGFELRVGELRFTSEREASFRVERRVDVVRLEVAVGSVRIERPNHGDVTIVAHEQWSAELGEPDEAPAPAKVDGNRRQAGGETRRSDAADQSWAATLAARRSGDAKRAHAALTEFAAAHPRDGRAGIALFEAARIAMDQLADPRGAIKLLERALARGASASYHRDALARLVEAYDAVGDDARCERERERFLAAYPSGAHHAAVAGACR